MSTLHKDEIIKMWNLGKTSGEIAETLKLTRSQVMGMVNRAQKAGLAERKTTTPVRPKPTKTVMAVRLRPKVITPLSIVSPPKRVEEPRMKAVVPPPIPRKTTGKKTLLQLEAYDCRWMTPDGKFCGEPSPSSQQPWCPEHRKLVYVAGTAKRIKLNFRF